MEINDDINLNVLLTKNKLIELCGDLFTKAMNKVESALNTAQLTPKQIDHVVNYL